MGAIAEIVDDAGQPLRAPALRRFADEHGLVMISIADLIAHLDATDAAARDAAATTGGRLVDTGSAAAPANTTTEGDRIA